MVIKQIIIIKKNTGSNHGISSVASVLKACEVASLDRGTFKGKLELYDTVWIYDTKKINVGFYRVFIRYLGDCLLPGSSKFLKLMPVDGQLQYTVQNPISLLDHLITDTKRLLSSDR